MNSLLFTCPSCGGPELIEVADSACVWVAIKKIPGEYGKAFQYDMNNVGLEMYDKSDITFVCADCNFEVPLDSKKNRETTRELLIDWLIENKGRF